MSKALLIFLVCTTYAFCYDFMTWNIRCEHVKDTLSGDVWSKRLPHIVETIEFISPDFFNVQETNPKFINDLENKLPDYNHIDSKEQSHNAIFFKKKFAVNNTGEFYLSETPNERSLGWDAKHHRTCLWVKLQDENKHVFFLFNTHLDNKGKHAQIHGASMIKDSIRNIAEDATILLAGDFNAIKKEKPIETLNKSGFLEEAQTKAKRIYNPSGSYNYFDPKRYSLWQFDYIFTSKDIEITRYSVPNFIYYDKEDEILRFPSDHSPVIIEFNIQ